MKTREEREDELYDSGMVDSTRQLFADKDVQISEEYYILMADYIDALDTIKGRLNVNPVEIGRRLPDIVKSIEETDSNETHVKYDGNKMQVNKNLSYREKKLQFFRELTHMLQVRYHDEDERYSFYNGRNGLFLTEGTTQFTAQILFNVSNGAKSPIRQEKGAVRGDPNRTVYSPLDEYQYNGSVLQLFSSAVDLSVPQILGLAYKEDGRETLRKAYESKEGTQIGFDELMTTLDQIYSIDSMIKNGNEKQLQGENPIDITMQDGVTKFQGNLETYKKSMDKVEQILLETYIKNHDPKEISANASRISRSLTTPELKERFAGIVHDLNSQQLEENDTRSNDDNRSGPSLNNETRNDMQQKEIQQNESDREDQQKKQGEPVHNKLTLRQKVALFLQKHNLIASLPLVDKFIHKQLDMLPERTETTSRNIIREEFINQLTNNGELRKEKPKQLETEQVQNQPILESGENER